MKNMKSFRLDDVTASELEQLAAREKISQSDVLAILVHCAFLSGDTAKLSEWFEIARRL